MDKKEKLKRSILIIIIMVIACVSIMSSRERRRRIENEKHKMEVKTTGEFNSDIIKVSYAKSTNKNYLISPYNIEVALNMLREGSSGNTKAEIDKVIGNRTINDVSIKDKLNIANGVFIKNIYQNDVKKDFISVLDTKYHAEIIYDEFNTPDKINNWVKAKTNNMIDKILDQMDKDFVLGLASAMALDVNWTNSFECNNTTSEEFNKVDNSKMNVEMMHQTYKSSARYIENNEVKGIILPYETNSNNELEFVGIIPNNVNDYIKDLSKDKINNLLSNSTIASNKLHINLSLPRFTYSYEIADFIEVLKDLGIKEAFDNEKANFKEMIDIKENVYVGEAIHKTKIELNEKGTKAAAVTYFGMFKNSAMIEDEFEEITIKFNKPFIYMIREKNTGEILFFGTVFEPNKWEKTTYSNSDVN